MNFTKRHQIPRIWWRNSMYGCLLVFIFFLKKKEHDQNVSLFGHIFDENATSNCCFLLFYRENHWFSIKFTQFITLHNEIKRFLSKWNISQTIHNEIIDFFSRLRLSFYRIFLEIFSYFIENVPFSLQNLRFWGKREKESIIFDLSCANHTFLTKC